MARRLILPLILLLALAAVLFYVGGDRVVQFEIIPKPTELEPGQVTLQFAIILAALALLATVLVWSLIVWLWKLPRRMKSGIGRKRENRGVDALERALLAVETGDAPGAMKTAKQAQGLLNRPALTTLVSAKAAELADEQEVAENYYETLKENPKTRSAGLRGLARIAVSRGDHKAAIDVAKTALEENPGKSALWALVVLFKSQIALDDWVGALETLDLAEKRKLWDKPEIRRKRSVLLSARATELETGGEQEQARNLAKQAAELAPDFAPATALAARLFARDGQIKKAAGLIEKAWAKTPHPALALAYKDLWQGEELKTLSKKIKALIKANPAHRESVILSAEMALDNGDGVAALSALDALLQSGEPSARLCVLSARAEGLLQNDIDARTWQHRAACAPVEADWSDLDPDGPAFNYTNEDWRRLVISFGRSGVLIHPRYEAHKRRRPVVDDLVNDGVLAQEEKINPPSADDPGIDDSNVDGLADRLENLLDDDVKL